jgi:TolB-like protein
MGNEPQQTGAVTVETLPDIGKNASRKQRKKVRGAWISFIGRIVAQVIGAVATITLGLIVVERYHASNVAEGSSGAQPTDVAHARSNPAPPVRLSSGKTSIAVLPLQNFSADSTHQYIADGLTDALVAGLASANEIRVISRTSSMQYRAQSKSVTEIGRELSVDWIVEGSIVKDGSRLRIIAQLIRADSDEHVWARSYDRSAHDLLSMEEELARTISGDVLTVLRQKTGE